LASGTLHCRRKTVKFLCTDEGVRQACRLRFIGMNYQKRRRIGVDFHGWSGIYQGSRSHLFGIYSEAIRLAPELDFHFLAEDADRLGREWECAKATNVQVHELPLRHGLFRLLVQLPLAVCTNKLDVLHVQYRIPPLFVGRTAVTIHDVLFESHPQFFPASFIWQSKFFYRFAARFACQIFTVSEYSKQEIVERYAVEAVNVVVTRNGVDLGRFSDVELESDQAALSRYGLTGIGYVMTVGRLEPRKNHATLVRAFRKMRRHDLTLVLVGQRDFAYHEALAQVALARKEGFRVLVLEDVSDADLPVLLRHARVFAYIAFAEGFGMPPLEAMASGVPVVVANATALVEVVGPAGLLVDPNSDSDVADAITRLLADPDLCADLSRRGRARAACFTWRAAALNLVTAFRAMVGTSEAPAKEGSS
jgi:glycosyltransferase involved in cell wall biosynthesis